MQRKKPQLPRGYWESAAGQNDLEQLRRREATADTLAQRRGTTIGGVEAALRRDTHRKAGLGAHRKAKPGVVPSVLSGLARSVELARAFADESMLLEIADLRRQLAECRGVAVEKEQAIEILQTQLNALQAEAQRLESRLTEGRMLKAGVIPGGR